MTVENKVLNFYKWIAAGFNAMLVLPPTLYHFGFTKVSKAMYFIMGFFCHQRADRSFYLFGKSIVYSKEYVLAQVPLSKVFTLDFSERFLGNELLGYKFGVCSRDTGIYIGLLVGLFVGKLFIKLKIPKILIVLLFIPLVLDGGIQTVAYIISPENGFYESNNIRRLITGLMFGFALGYFSVSALESDIAKKV